jgi:hypothetical protein
MVGSIDNALTYTIKHLVIDHMPHGNVQKAIDKEQKGSRKRSLIRIMVQTRISKMQSGIVVVVITILIVFIVTG